jgi:four helix bundle protein
MNKEELQLRTKRFSIDIVNLCDSLPKTFAMDVFFRQIIRSSSSIGANYRAVCRAKSVADFLNKLKIVEEEADETIYFLELIKELNKSNLMIDKLLKEANELLSIFVAAIKTTRNKINTKS